MEIGVRGTEVGVSGVLVVPEWFEYRELHRSRRWNSDNSLISMDIDMNENFEISK